MKCWSIGVLSRQQRSASVRSRMGECPVQNEAKGYPSFLVVTTATLLAAAPMIAVPVMAEQGPGMLWGHPGKLSDVSRTIEIDTREIGFRQKSIEVYDGETIRFVIRNTGQMVHDFAIGPFEAQARRRAQVAQVMSTGTMDTGRMQDSLTQTRTSRTQEDPKRSGPRSLDHSMPNAVLVHRGEIRELIWAFSRAQNLEFACNMPGHYELGMRGKFVFAR